MMRKCYSGVFVDYGLMIALRSMTKYNTPNRKYELCLLRGPSYTCPFGFQTYSKYRSVVHVIIFDLAILIVRNVDVHWKLSVQRMYSRSLSTHWYR